VAKVGTVDEVLDALTPIVRECRHNEDPAGLFAAVYVEVTRAIKLGIEQGSFDDGARMSAFDAVFAQRYLDAYERRTDPSNTAAWQVAFDASPRGDLIAMQHLLLGMNAHINLDLGLAVAASGVDLDGFHGDFTRINAILGDMLDRVQDVLDGVSPLLRLLDTAIGGADEWLAVFAMSRARAHAWDAAQVYRALEITPRLSVHAQAIMANAAAHLGRRIADPGQPTSAVVSLVRRREQWKVSQLIDAFDGLGVDLAVGA